MNDLHILRYDLSQKIIPVAFVPAADDPCHLWLRAPSHVDTDNIYHITYRIHNYFHLISAVHCENECWPIVA